MTMSIETPDIRSSNNGFIFLTYLMESTRCFNGQKEYHRQVTLQNETSSILNLIGVTYAMENVYDDWIFVHPRKNYILGTSQGITNYLS